MDFIIFGEEYYPISNLLVELFHKLYIFLLRLNMHKPSIGIQVYNDTHQYSTIFTKMTNSLSILLNMVI